MNRGIAMGVATGFLALAGCSSSGAPRLAGNCDSVFADTASRAEGTCNGSDGRVQVSGTQCGSGQELMLAERVGGEDYAWARVGSAWHLLTPEGTNSKPFRDCTGQ